MFPENQWRQALQLHLYSSVVVVLDVLVNGIAELLSCLELPLMAIVHLPLHGAEECLHLAVVQAVAFPCTTSSLNPSAYALDAFECITASIPCALALHGPQSI